ncbi:MAG TPA: hypothetical protein VHJ38_00450 [Nitrososphaeraceae archaeon]|nr:hypothetical protein [Nitrososphaeraceae archaeon]
MIEFFNFSTPVRISSMRGSCWNMYNTSSLNEACGSCVPSASLASILQKILVSFAFLGLSN